MKKYRKLLAGGLFGVLALGLSSVLLAGEKATIAYPEGYRSWTHVKSMVILPGHALADPFRGIHHIYANDKALKGYQTNHFPDGSVLVFDLLEEQAGDNALQEGKRKVLGVMVKDAVRYKDSGGWGYQAFKGDSKTERLVTDMVANCHGCHASQQKSDFVYSKMRK